MAAQFGVFAPADRRRRRCGSASGSEGERAEAAARAARRAALVVGTFTYAGTGWKTTGDALLANTAADQARKRREAGRDQLADEYAETMASEAA